MLDIARTTVRVRSERAARFVKEATCNDEVVEICLALNLCYGILCHNLPSPKIGEDPVP